MSIRTQQRPTAARPALKPTVTPVSARTFPVGYVVAGALVVAGLAWATGRTPLAVLAVLAGAGVAWLVRRANIRAVQRAELQTLVAVAVLQAWGWGRLTPANVQLRRWEDEMPTWVRIPFARRGPVLTSEVASLIAESVSEVIGYPMSVVERKKRSVTLELAQPEVEEKVDPEEERIGEVLSSLMGPETTSHIEHAASGAVERIEVKHNVPTKAAMGTWRGRVERTLGAVLEGRWRANWNLTADTVAFELRPELPDMVAHPVGDITEANLNKIPFGVDEDGNTVCWDLKGPGPHLLDVGKTGTGKTVTINGVVMEWTRRNWPCYIVDPKRIEFLGLRDWPNIRYVATVVPDAIVLIHQAHEEMERRYSAIEHGADESDFEPYLLVLDEYRNLVRQVTAWYQGVKERGMPSKCRIFDEVAAIAEKGRSARVHIIMGTQRPDAEFLGGGLRDNFDTRISNGRLSPQGAVMMWDSPHLGVAVPRGKRGRGTAITSTEKVSEVQMYWTPDPRRALRDAKENDLAILEALKPDHATYGPCEIEWPVHIEDEDWSQDDPISWADCLEAQLVEAGTIRHPRTLTITQAPTAASADDAIDDEPTAVAGDDLPDVEDDYSTPMNVIVTKVRVGDLLLVDEDTQQWAVVSEEPEADEDAAEVCLEWRDDDDEAGALTMSDDTVVTIRRPNDEPAEED